MIKAVLFDADGVLIRGEKFSNYLAREYGLTKEITKDFFINKLPSCVLGKADLKEELPIYLHKWGWKKTVEQFIKEWNDSENNIDDQLIEYIKYLQSKNIICCLATNQTKNRFEYMVKDMQFEKYLDKHYCSAHLGHKKPDLKFYEKVVHDLQLDPNEIVFWDDDTENIQAAKEFGMYAEFYSDLDSFNEKMQKYLAL